ncbi:MULTISPECIES: hypothetical protein [Butyricimonas]|uniref:hypothetical protein n=1 Tax=Butyricimonas TaxID=574697 RepID=UPI0007FB3390|nr:MULTISPECIES: hypothetical protein [Butyricimonas]
MKVRLIVISVIAALLFSCNKEDEIKAREELEPSFVLPDNHEFDKILIRWHEQYGFFPLYEFEDHDIYWNGSMWDDIHDNRWEGHHIARPGDPAYVGNQIELIQSAFMDIYPEKYLKLVPLKMLLCSELYEAKYYREWTPGGTIETLDSTAVWSYTGYDFLAINGASEDILTMTLQDKQAFLREVNAAFLGYLGAKGLLELPQEFFDITDDLSWGYDYDDYDFYSELSGDALFVSGFLGQKTLIDGDLQQSMKNDAASFLQLAAYSLETLLAEPDRSLDDDGDVETMSWIGAFSRDPAGIDGICGKKYQVVIRYLKSLGIKTERFQNPTFEW